MGGGTYNMNSPQFEFNFKDEIYEGKGGCFVTTPKAIIYVVIALIALVFVALIMYYYGPYSSVVKTIENPMDIEKLLNYSVGNISQDIRLPKNVEPILYKLKLDPIVQEKNSSLRGEVVIRLKCLQKTRRIVLNAEKINIISVQVFRIEGIRSKRSSSENLSAETTKVNSAETTLSSSEGTTEATSTLTTTTVVVPASEAITTTEIPTTIKSTTEVTTIVNIKDSDNEIDSVSTIQLNITDHKYDELNAKYIIKLRKDLDVAKQYLLNIKYTSNISDAFQGLYQAVYTDKISILATQLQPIYARKMFPCFDEPSFNSPIQLTIRKYSNTTMLSNTPLLKTYRDDEQKIWNEFVKTHSIPTYLLGFIIGDLVKVQEKIHKPLIRIWGLADSKIEALDAINFTKKILGHLEKYFELSYPLSKVDIVAVRQLRFTVASPGLIFIKESLFLPSTKSDDQRKTELFSELTKSLTKEWIGNLVSMNWWNDFWLINGFSVFMLEELRSELGYSTSDFALQITQETMQSDDLKSASSLRSDVENSVQIFDISDNIKSNKAACIMRMLNFSLAPLTFRKGIQSFVKEWQGNSTDEEHLWNAIGSVTTKIDDLPEDGNVTEIMESWSRQATYPLVTVTKDFQNNGLDISQTKFHFDVNDTESSLWMIPITYMIGSHDNVETKRFWLTEKSAEINQIANDIKDKWVLFNVGQREYYRVNYGVENWKLLVNVLSTSYSKIPIENRGQLINDAFDLAEHGLLDYHIPFNLSRYLINETDYIPWASALKSLEFIRSILETTYLNGAYEDYVANLVGNIYDQISIENDEKNTNKARLKNLIVATACSINYSNCTHWAMEKLREWIKNPEANIPNRKTAFCTAIHLSGRKEWEIMFGRLHTEEVGTEDLYFALGCTKHLWLINRYLDSTLNGSIPTRYVSHVWQSIHNIPSRTFGFKYLRENWDKIHSIYKEKRLILKTIIRDFLYTLSTKSDKDDLSLFFGKHEKDLQGFSYLLKGVVDRIDTRIAWVEKHLKTIDTWFSSYEYK